MDVSNPAIRPCHSFSSSFLEKKALGGGLDATRAHAGVRSCYPEGHTEGIRSCSLQYSEDPRGREKRFCGLPDALFLLKTMVSPLRKSSRQSLQALLTVFPAFSRVFQKQWSVLQTEQPVFQQIPANQSGSSF